MSVGCIIHVESNHIFLQKLNLPENKTQSCNHVSAREMLREHYVPHASSAKFNHNEVSLSLSNSYVFHILT